MIPPSQSSDDVCLMTRAKQGDRQAYTLLYEKYVPIVRKYISGRDNRVESQEDLVQEVFTRLWEHRGRYRAGMPVFPYLLAFAKNVHREHRARRRREARAKSREHDVTSMEVGPDVVARHNEGVEWVRSYLAELPPKRRQAVELVYLGQMPVTKAAKVMNCSAEALRQNLCEARRQFAANRLSARNEESEPF
jgi:RNA polymerase sigma factor (sigma-70 family)